MQPGFERAPFLGRGAVNQRGVIRDPGQPAAQVGEFISQQLAGLQILDPRGVAFTARSVGGKSEIAPVLADRGCAKAEIFQPLSQTVFIEQQLRLAPGNDFAPMLAILRAFLELAPVEELAILLRNGAVVFLDARAHFGEQRLGQRGLGGHLRFEIGVFRLHVVEHVLIIHHRIGFVIQPVIRVFDGDPVVGVGVRALFSDGRLDLGNGSRCGGRCGHAGLFLFGGGDDRSRGKGGGNKRDGKRALADPCGHWSQIPVSGLGGNTARLGLCWRF